MLLHVETPAPPLLVAAVALYATTLLHLVAKDIERAKWQRHFGGWRALQRDRVERARLPIPSLRALLAAHMHPLPTCGSGWRAVGRHRIERAAVW